MLKLIYTEDGLILESVNRTLNALISQRIKLSLATAQPFYMENSTATLLLNLDAGDFKALQQAIAQDQTQSIQASVLEGDCVEVTLTGTWLSQNPDSESGIFLAVLGHDSEILIQDYWKISELQVA
jgi:hypothetical protein